LIFAETDRSKSGKFYRTGLVFEWRLLVFTEKPIVSELHSVMFDGQA
jgi:hypothetical protein